MLGNERIFLQVGHQEIRVVTEQNRIISISEWTDTDSSTLQVSLKEETLATILSSPDPARAFLQEKNEGKVMLQGKSISRKVKFSLVSGILRFVGYGEKESSEQLPARRLASPQVRQPRPTRQPTLRETIPVQLPSAALEEVEEVPVEEVIIQARLCTTSVDCPLDKVCQEGSCVVPWPASLSDHRCAEDTDCRRGMACRDGFCVIPISEREGEDDGDDSDEEEGGIMDLIREFLGGDEEEVEPADVPEEEDTAIDEPEEEEIPAETAAELTEEPIGEQLLCQTFADESYPVNSDVACSSVASPERTLKIVNDLGVWYGASSIPVFQNDVVWLMYAEVGGSVQYLFGGDAMGLDCNVADGQPVVSPGQEMVFSFLDDTQPEETLVYDIRPFLGTWDVPRTTGGCWQRNVHNIIDCSSQEIEKARSIRITQPPHTQAVIRLSRFFPDSSYHLEWC